MVLTVRKTTTHTHEENLENHNDGWYILGSPKLTITEVMYQILMAPRWADS